MEGKRCFIFVFICFLGASACRDDGQVTPSDEDVLSGGEATIFSTGPDAYTFPLPLLSGDGLNRHFVADGMFGQQFVSAPADQFGGLGPLFNQNSCEGCHVRNGRGIIPRFDGDASTGLLLRLSIPGEGPFGLIPAPGYGGQLQHKSMFGGQPEGKVSRSEIALLIEYLDGNSVTLIQPSYQINEGYTTLPDHLLISARNAPPVFGIGLLEAIPEHDIVALADPEDADADGISGKVNMVWDVLEQRHVPGRFGWKAEQPTAAQQAADAAHNDMGLTSHYFPAEHCEGQSNCMDGLQSEHDVDAETVDLFAFYFQTLAVPARRNADDPGVVRGKSLFSDIGCVKCHVPRHETGTHTIHELSGQVIFPYTDMLLHDMGPGLSDQRPVFDASGEEWRTPPLWGIGLTQVVNSEATYLHDGRARTLEEAILWHGGEAEKSKEDFRQLTLEERETLIQFLLSL